MLTHYCKDLVPVVQQFHVEHRHAVQFQVVILRGDCISCNELKHFVVGHQNLVQVKCVFLIVNGHEAPDFFGTGHPTHKVLGLVPLDLVKLALVGVDVQLFLIIGHSDTVDAANTLEFSEQNPILLIKEGNFVEHSNNDELTKFDG